MGKRIWVFIILYGLFLAIIIPSFSPGKGENDFLRYWSASRLLLTGGNPYDEISVRNLQKLYHPKSDIRGKDVGDVWNPPLGLLFLVPFGILPFTLAFKLWIFINVLLLVMALFMTWRMALGSNYQRFFPLVLIAVFLFGNTIFLLRLGQISTIVLISLVLGIFLIEREKDFLAGAVLLLTIIKPHLVYLILPVIVVWSIQTRRWKIIMGMVLGGIFASIAAWLLFPNWLTVYRNTISRLPYSEIYCSTLGSFAASVWGITYFRYIGVLLLPLTLPLSRLIVKSGWLTTVNLSLIISIPLAPYGFSFDQVLLLPAVAEMIAWLIKKELASIPSKIILGCLITIYGASLWMMTIQDLPYYWDFLIGFSLFILYFVSWKCRCERR
jgi:hypothetical protein